MRTVVYLRLSQDRDNTGLGVDRQREDCMLLARTRGWTITAEHIDNDVSAAGKTKRPGFEAVLSALADRGADAVIAWDMTRLTRNRRDTVRLIETGEKTGATLAFVRGSDLDLGSPAGRLTADILAGVARHEIDQKGDRSRREVKQRAEQSRPHGGPRMYGVDDDGRTLREDESATLRQWYDMLLAGATVTSLAKLSGRHHSSVLKILRNPRNAGIRMLNGVTYPASNPAIVPESTWRAAVGILSDADRRVSFSNAYKYFGAGLFTCSECSMPVRTAYTSYKYGHVRIYRCSKMYGGCGRSWQAGRIDEWVIELVAQWIAKNKDRMPVGDRGDEMARLSSEAAGIRRRRAQLGPEFAADDDADVQEFKDAALALRERLNAIEARMAAAGSTGALAALTASPDPVQAWRDMTDPARRRAIVNAVMTVRLLPARRGRTPKDWDPSDVVEVVPVAR